MDDGLITQIVLAGLFILLKYAKQSDIFVAP